MIEVTVITALKLFGDPVIDGVSSLVPETRKLASRVVLVARLEVEVPSVALPNHSVLGGIVRRGLVEVAFKADKISHASTSVSKSAADQADETYVATVLSIMTYMPRLWISSIPRRHSSMFPKC